MMLNEYLLTLPTYALADMYDELYKPGVRVHLSDEGYRRAITEYWEDAGNWNEFVAGLTPTERKMLLRLALQAKIPINAFMERLADLGVLMLQREANRYGMPDDVRWQMLERLPSLQERMEGLEQGDEDGSAPV